MTIKEFVQKYDPQNQFDVLVNSYLQIENAWSNQIRIGGINPSEISNIIISGLGGSAISADLIKNFLRDELSIPLFVNRNYWLPKFASKKTLFIASSYSGNTEETVSSLEQAIELGCKIICISTGGEIESIAKSKNITCIKVQEGKLVAWRLCRRTAQLLDKFPKLTAGEQT